VLSGNGDGSGRAVSENSSGGRTHDDDGDDGDGRRHDGDNSEGKEDGRGGRAGPQGEYPPSRRPTRQLTTPPST